MDFLKNEKRIVAYVCLQLDNVQPAQLRERMHVLRDLMASDSIFVTDADKYIKAVCPLPTDEDEDDA